MDVFEILDMFKSKINEMIELNVNHVSKGNADDYADYAGQCGVVKGLRMSLDTLQIVVDDLRLDDDD